uniref:Putative replicase n=1 Tax=Monsystermes virus TaxID=2796617 RepID=A0A7T7K8Y0_9VIRU|nr:putative replicase [Monsystermes virus]
MDTKVRGCLCKSFRACGLPKDRTHSLLNKISKWVDSCGVEWTSQRLKDYHTWYISYLAGSPVIPEGCAHNKDGTPKGEFRPIFALKNHQLALAVLSGHTVFRNSEISITQWTKLREALNTKGSMCTGLTSGDQQSIASAGPKRRIPTLSLTPVPLDSLTGLTIPVGRSKVHVDPINRDSYALAYLQTCKTIPQHTVRFYLTAGVGEYLPGGKDGILAREVWNPSNPEFWQENVCGHISCVQEPSLKARWIANPNRGMQHALRSLQHDWEDSVVRRFSTQDCTLNQERGCKDVMSELKQGRTLASVDLTSATDLLSVDKGIDILLLREFGYSYEDPWWRVGQGVDLTPNPKSTKDEQNRYLYWLHVKHFKQTALGDWLAPDHQVYSWKQGQPLGTAPSFSLLAYTNNALAAMSANDCGVKDPFWRVIGDDIVMRVEMFERYKERVQEFGGVINLQKTIVSNRLAEFGGRVIEPSGISVKRIKWPVLSDNTFIEVCSALGQQSVGMLRPRQRRAFSEYKYVPGYVVNGPWSQQSHGQPLDKRYFWYLEYSGLCVPRIEPDKIPKLMGDKLGLYLGKFIKEVVPSAKVGPGEILGFLPTKVPNDFQSLDAASIAPRSGDPRLTNGETTLEMTERVSKRHRKAKFEDVMLNPVAKPPISTVSLEERNPKVPIIDRVRAESLWSPLAAKKFKVKGGLTLPSDRDCIIIEGHTLRLNSHIIKEQSKDNVKSDPMPHYTSSRGKPKKKGR